MARLTRRDATAPRAIKVGGETKWICMCGLTKNEPFCDNSHELCDGEDPDSLYEYTETGERIFVGKRVESSEAENLSEKELLEKLKEKSKE